MFGMMPAYGFFLRHARNVSLQDVDLAFIQEDHRPAFVLDQVSGVDLQQIKLQKVTGVPAFVLNKVKDVTIHRATSVADTHVDSAERKEM